MKRFLMKRGEAIRVNQGGRQRVLKRGSTGDPGLEILLSA